MLGLLSLAVKAGLYVGALGSTGLALHTLLLGTSHRRWIIGLALVLAMAVTGRLLLLNAELTGGLQHSFDFSMFDWVWAPNRMQVLTYIVGASLLALSAIFDLRILLAVGVASVFAGAGLGGHTHGLEAPGINPFLVSVHVAIAAFWATAPFVLWPQKKVSDAVLLNRMERFSRVAVWCIPVLFVSGLWLAWRLSGSLEALIGETYGQLLLLKLLLACCALAIGAFNKLRVTELLRDRTDKGRERLRTTLALDYMLFSAIVFVIAAATTLTGPG